MNIVVTGCSGYIGSVLVGMLLRKGYRVLGIDNFFHQNVHGIVPYLGDSNFKFLQGDVQDEHVAETIARVADVVIPLAALVGAPLCEKDEHHVRWANSTNSWAISNVVGKLSRNQRVIYPNTNSGYGQTDGESEVTESDPLSPISVYGQTKCEGEESVLSHENGVSMRLATVFGVSPRMRFDLMVNDFTLKLHQIRSTLRSPMRNTYVPLCIFEPQFKRNFVHVHDVCRAFLHMIERWDLTGAYNLGHPKANLTKMQLALAICEALELPSDVVQVGDGVDPDKRNYIVSNERILNTGFIFARDLQDGVLEIANYLDSCPASATATMRNV